MNAFYCSAKYPSELPCDAESRFRSVQIVEASDFVLAQDVSEARDLFCQWHLDNIPAEAVKVERRFEIDPVVLNTLTWGREPKPVGDMALFDYWEWLTKVNSVAI